MNIYGELPILGFFGAYRFLSNFWPAVVELDGEVYPTVEHAYQAAKTFDLEARRAIREESSSGRAKRAGKHCVIREDWEQVKVQVMHDLLKQKFADPQLRGQLLATGESYLEETNSWGDTFWGKCNNIGFNTLGNLLMGIREEIRNGTSPQG